MLAEARRLVAQGAREITLLGQNVNAWHGEAPDGGTWGLGRLLRELAELPGLLRLRYTTSHPRDMDDELIAAHRDLPTLMPFLHLPVQSGSDRVLAAMNRRHTAADYLRAGGAAARCAAGPRAVVRLHRRPSGRDRGRLPRRRMALVREVGFAQAYSFKYSPRPGTPAAGAPGQVPEAEKDRRLQTLQALLREQQARFNAGCVGLTLPVLFTGPGRHPGQVAGRSPFLQPVHVTGPPALIGSEISGADSPPHCPNSLSGTLRTEERAVRLTPHRRRQAVRHPPPPPRRGKAVTLQFSDNTLLPLLLGDHDRHLVRIEQALGVRLSCRGNRVAITGEAARVDAAQATLEGAVAPAGARRERRAGRKSRRRSAWRRPTTDPRLPLPDLPAIRTRRGGGWAAQPGPGGLYRRAGAA